MLSIAVPLSVQKRLVHSRLSVSIYWMSEWNQSTSPDDGWEETQSVSQNMEELHNSGSKTHLTRKKKNKTDPLLAFVWGRKGLHEGHTKCLISWTYYPSVSKVIFHWISPCIWKQNNSHLKNLITSIFPPNPLTARVFLAAEITSDYSMKCNSGENCMFQDVCTIQLSNIHTVMILKERTQCREIGNKIKAPGCIERRQPKDSCLTYLIPGTGN